MDIGLYLGFIVSEMSKFLLYEAYYDKVQPNFREKSIQVHLKYIYKYKYGYLYFCVEYGYK